MKSKNSSTYYKNHQRLQFFFNQSRTKLDSVFTEQIDYDLMLNDLCKNKAIVNEVSFLFFNPFW